LDVCERSHVAVNELADLLHAVVKDDHEEIRIRIAFLTKKYARVIEQPKAAD
jgi:hypothetical protein